MNNPIKTFCALCKPSSRYSVVLPANFSPDALDSKTFSARRIPDRLHYRIVRCNNCGLVRSNPILPPDKITSLYARSTVSYQSEIPYLEKTYAHYLQKALPFIPSTERFLDIGCGNGFFLSNALQFGFDEVYGVEPGKDAVRKAPKHLRKNIMVDLFHASLFTPRIFDVITCFHTLDHVINPNKFIQDMRTVLKPDGIVICIVHNIDALIARLLKERCPIFDIEHIYLFNKQTLARIFDQNGFDVIDVFDVKNTYPVRYWMRMSPLPFKSALMNLLKRTGIDSIPLSVFAGNIGIIAKKA